MNSSSSSTIIAVVLGILVLLVALYMLFVPKNTPSLVAETQPASVAEQTFITLTAKINPVIFDTSILSDPRFGVLQDIKTTVIPENAGRPDPFAPLPGVK